MSVTSPNQKWMRVADKVRHFSLFFYEGENFTLMWWVILSLRKLLQTAMHWHNRLLLTLEFLTFKLFFLTVYNYVVYKQKSMQWRHLSVRIALRDINKKGAEIGESQNRCHDDKTTLQNTHNVPFGINLQVCVVLMMINHLNESLIHTEMLESLTEGGLLLEWKAKFVPEHNISLYSEMKSFK